MPFTLPRASRRAVSGVAIALLAALLAVVDVGTLTPAAHAADTDPVFSSVSGGTRVNVGGAVRSELTAASNLRVTTAGRSAVNNTAAVDVLGGLITAEGVSTRQRTTRTLSGGTMITSEAKIAGVTLLGGAITVDAVETRATATLDGDQVRRSGGTKFVGLDVRGHNVPLIVPRNLTLTIPGLATVVLNRVTGQLGGDALIKSVATSIHVTLLQPYGGLNAGASIEITPTLARILVPMPIDGEPVFGAAYATRVGVHVGDALNLASAPTSLMIAPAGGTNDVELTNAAAKASLPGLVKANTLSGSARVTVTSTESDGTMYARAADVSLLNGAITVDALTSMAHVRKAGSNAPTANGSSQLVGLTIGGRAIPVNVAPNTVYTIPGLVKVIVNEQIRRTAYLNGITVRALHVIALPDAPNDIAGIDIEIGVAAVAVLD